MTGSELDRRCARGPRLARAGLAAALLTLGCSGNAAQEEEAEDLTIVVEADKSRILEEEQALASRRSEMESERDRLARERADVEQKLSTLSKKDRKAREKLEAEQQRLAADEKQIRERAQKFDSERAKLDREKSELLERISSLTRRGQGGLTVEQREAGVARREKDIAEREEALAKREARLGAREAQVTSTLQELSGILDNLKAGGGKTVIVNAPSAAPAAAVAAATATVTKAQAQKAQRSLRGKMESKGILMEDLPPTARTLYGQGDAAMDAKEFGEAVAAFEQTEAIVDGIAIDQSFVQAKMGRLNRAVANKQLDETETKKVQGLLADVSNAFADGRFDRANKKANQIAVVLKQD